jgi:predicted RNA-binding protein with PIN domain
MHVFIDGYNVINDDAALKMLLKHSLEAARESLLQRLNSSATLRRAETVTVVFDGSKEGQERQTVQSRGRIKVIFSKRGEIADAIIKQLAAQHGPNCRVITRDSELRSFTVAQGGSAGIIKRRPPVSAKKDENEETGWNKSTRKKGQARRQPRKQRRQDPGEDVYW